MATIVLTAIGTAIGGPIGGALGAFVGQQADRAVFGSGSREGPRLKELSVTKSSYGQPMPRHFGRMRVGGSVIWATDLVENSSTSGGKGKPKTTSYSYSASFAVALSSTPIERVGRIWADGNLLRGAADDLKVEGELRIYKGNGDAPVDPLIAADKGRQTPGFRDCAYAVFENLQLADFGNRIPALTFEIFAREDASVSLKQLVPSAFAPAKGINLPHTRGFADEGGALSSTLSVLDRVYPLTCATTRDGLQISALIDDEAGILTLPPSLASEENEDAQTRTNRRTDTVGREPVALRYYDEERDYQPGVQRAIGLRPNGRETMVDLPATLTANGAKALANQNAHRARWYKENLIWRVAELNPAIQPGRLVRVPDRCGTWRVKSWEWHDRGIELGLERIAPGSAPSVGADTGVPSPPNDLVIPGTALRVFEAPQFDGSNPSQAVVLAAASASSSAWKGAALYLEQGTTLSQVGLAGSQRSVTGELLQPLVTSPALFFEPNAELELQLVAYDSVFETTDITGIAGGRNMLLVGSEVIQFLSAQSLGDGRWRLSGLLRGRGGTEEFAQTEHHSGTPATLLDDRVTELLDLPGPVHSTTRIAAIGRGDQEAVLAAVENAGLSRRPPSPVHPIAEKKEDQSLWLRWTRRARGQWSWNSEGGTPLVEESERYQVGYGPVDAPHSVFPVEQPPLILGQSEVDALLADHGPGDLWVRQIGTFAASTALHLTSLS
jgi:hypothetical protein